MSHRVVLLSDFNVEPLARLLERRFEATPSHFELAPFGQAYEILHDLEHPCWSDAPNAALIWTSPTRVSASFQRAVHREAFSAAACEDEVAYYAQLVARIAAQVESVFVPAFVGWPWWDRCGLLEWHAETGTTHMLHRMNQRLIDELASVPGVHVLDARGWLDRGRGFDPRGWYAAKMPFDASVYGHAADELVSALRAVRGHARKIVVTDLDGMLWGGVVGDDGWKGLKLGGHDPAGEAFADVQRLLKTLANRGILLGIVSKNEEATALHAIENHPEMLLRREDFVGWRINWDDKAQNLVALLDELNLGPESAVFLDDNPVERQRIRDMLPEVAVPDLPENALRVPAFLASLNHFNTASVSADDRKRTAMYRSRREAEELRDRIGSIDDWLESLETIVTFEPLHDGNLERTVQLLNKTNQMNLATRRLTQAELLHWLDEGDRRLLTFRVRDRFGDSGLTGIASLEWSIETQVAQIVDFVLSCRVMGRKVEETLVHVLVEQARACGAKEVRAELTETAKNQPCLRFWNGSGFERDVDSLVFRWDAARPYPAPAPIRLVAAEPR